MKKTLISAVTVALALCAPVLAATAPAGNGGEIGFDYGTLNADSDTTGVDSTSVIALRGGYNLNKQWMIEGQVSSASESANVLGSDIDMNMRLIMVNGVMNFHPPRKEFVPYIRAGLGQASVEVEDSTTSVSDGSVALQIGGGTRIYFGKAKRAAFRADVAILRQSTFDEDSTNTSFTGGFTWRLGGR